MHRRSRHRNTWPGAWRQAKPGEGVIRLEARHSAGMLNIRVSDDGCGVKTWKKIRRLVVERKMAQRGHGRRSSAPRQLLAFLFLPGFSLKESADEISGRGVGLDIVYETIRQQYGMVRLESEPGKISIPLLRCR